jgi:hypothetical protein
MIAGLSSNIQNREFTLTMLGGCLDLTSVAGLSAANQNIEQDLHASPSSISLSLSLFILCQGHVPLLWSAISEIKGRKV